MRLFLFLALLSAAGCDCFCGIDPEPAPVQAEIEEFVSPEGERSILQPSKDTSSGIMIHSKGFALEVAPGVGIDMATGKMVMGIGF
jgi:hypothetical protein